MERQRYYTASEGMTYKRKVDGAIVGHSLYLGKFIDGSVDVIDNYEEVIDEELKKRNEERQKRIEEMRSKNEERFIKIKKSNL